MSRPHWQDIPFHFKQDVVAHLDFKTRRSLEKCSKSEYAIVKTVPLILSSLLLDLSPDDTESSWYTDTTPGITLTTLLVQERPFSRGLHWRDESQEKTIENLKLIFDNPKIIIKEMIFTIDGNPAKFIEKLLANFGNRKFHVEKLLWTSVEVARNQKQLASCLKFFDLFDAGTLKKLEINFSQKTLIREMMKMSQFQGLVEEIFIRSEIENDHLENVYHSKQVKVQLEEVRAEDLKKAIEVFQTKSLGSFFKFSTNEIQIDLDKALETFRSMPDNCSVPTNQFYERDTNTHRFEILDRTTERGEPLVLYMKIQKNSVWGVVCRSDHISKDMNSCPYF
ncbi:hypothetical protein GCK72_021876 [Caenorhabditis remanei]|uniref:DUF38 domain-containing protein n=1 Tax=Caenorhabditis remanei TaxID=31234 RepID=A0A6A5GJ79_CAERE|nr:hypothetical protein GCK72_021876 [Caenorhabditis remanei]KAF1755307.1 hypothetical protein GCK72_021876 [Caenorhabditis remanei]